MPFSSVLSRAAAAVLAALLLVPATAAAAQPTPMVDGICMTDAEPDEVLAALPGATLLYDYDIIPGFAIRLPAYLMDNAAALPGVSFSVSPTYTPADATLSPMAVLDPSLLSDQDTAVRSADPLAGDGRLIAVLDSGFDVTHPLFTMPEGASRKIQEDAIPVTSVSYQAGTSLWVNAKIPFAFDYSDMNTNVAGRSAHGTHVAATAAGYGELNGTAPGAQLALMKVFDDSGENCREYSLIAAIQDAVQLGADVINLSLGAPAPSSTEYAMTLLPQALAKAEEAGVLVICAMGNDGYAGRGGRTSDLPRAADPDYGLVSEPASMPQALGVAAASNAVTYREYFSIGERNFFFDAVYETSIGTAPSLVESCGDRQFPLRVIPGLGKAVDYVGIDCTGAAVLIRRGELTFEEKLLHATEAGAAMAIFYDPQGDEELLLSVGSAADIPAVLVSRADGEALSQLDGSILTVATTTTAFASDARPIADYSAFGPTSDLLLKPDITAVGSDVLSAIPGEKYGIMSGTSMATPQISGLAVRAMNLYGAIASEYEAADRMDFWRSYLISAAQPLPEGDTLITPRAQGGGVLDEDLPPVLLYPYDIAREGHVPVGRGYTVGSIEEGQATFAMHLAVHNLSDQDASYRISLSLLTDDARVGEDGIAYITGSSIPVPHTLSVGGETLKREGNHLRVTVPAGESVDFIPYITPDAAWCQSHAELFESGFYLEGYVTLTDDQGRHVASLPFLAFRGDFAQAPMMDALDADNGVSYYGENKLLQGWDEENIPAGVIDERALTVLYAFSPNEDMRADDISLSLALLRNASEAIVEIRDANGEVVYENAHFSLFKAMMQEGTLVTETIFLWDGSDGINPRYHWPDGHYTVEISMYSYLDRGQKLTFPVLVDTKKPTVTEMSFADDVLQVTARDEHYIKEMRIYLPGEGGEMAVDARYTPPHEEDGEDRRDPHSATMEAVIPAGVEYVYISAEDYAGNLTVIRWYP